MKSKIIMLYFAALTMSVATSCYASSKQSPNCLISLTWSDATVEDLVLFTDAIAWVESKQDPNVLPGDGGKAIGMFQMWEIMVCEVNRVNEKYKILVKCNGQNERYNYSDREDATRAREMCAVYLVYCTKYRGLTFLQACRCWNGGHDGYQQTSTMDYQNKIIRYIQENAQ